MAFDGITIAAMVSELNKNLSGGRINKIAQPENDELLITGKGAFWPEASASVCQRFSPSDLFHFQKQDQSSHCPQLLHASSQAHRKRKNHRNPAARTGTCGRI